MPLSDKSFSSVTPQPNEYVTCELCITIFESCIYIIMRANCCDRTNVGNGPKRAVKHTKEVNIASPWKCPISQRDKNSRFSPMHSLTALIAVFGSLTMY